MNRAVLLEHRDELLDAGPARLGLLRVVDAIEDRVAVGAVERLEELPRARAFPFKAARRSSGTSIVRAPEYAASHRPSAWAASTSRSPAGCISPRAMRSVAFSRLIFDHRLRSVRGVNRWRQWSSSPAAFCPSIHP
jgi:hypothetical protein